MVWYHVNGIYLSLLGSAWKLSSLLKYFKENLLSEVRFIANKLYKSLVFLPVNNTTKWRRGLYFLDDMYFAKIKLFLIHYVICFLKNGRGNLFATGRNCSPDGKMLFTIFFKGYYYSFFLVYKKERFLW